jgi:hypothetical protein
MAELIVNDNDLVVHLTLGEKLWAFHGNIRVPDLHHPHRARS